MFPYCIQEFVNDINILPALSYDHSPLLISLLNEKSDKNSPGFWKFNNKKSSLNVITQTNLWKTPQKLEILNYEVQLLIQRLHAYTDARTFFRKDSQSIAYLVDYSITFSFFQD